MMRVVVLEVEELGRPMATIYLPGTGNSRPGRRGCNEVGTLLSNASSTGECPMVASKGASS